jgi:chitinase
MAMCRYCGSTKEFCTWKGCDTKYGGCGDAPRPSCGGGSSVSKRTIGYYESWANIRSCQKVSPEDLNLNGFTHINFAFSFFDPSTFEISPMDANGGSLYSRFTGLKSKQSGLQTWISVGGWSFTDPGPTRSAFSDMASNSGNRQKFINGLVKFMDTFGFDGVDLDWEYPGADDRGGKSEDTANYVLLTQELKAAFGSKYGISMTLPTSYWYLQHFDLKGIQDHVDWFNLMAYDLHGTWDSVSKFVGPYIAPHANITEIDLGLDLLWRSGVTPEKIVMGEGWYGRSFTLKDPSCSTPNGACEFSGGANAGPCSNAAGILDNQEIQDIITKNNLKPVHDEKAAVKWITWDNDQWVSFDDDDTFKQKRDFANSRCLGGLMVWAMDQIDQTGSNGLGPAPGITKSQKDDVKQISADEAAGVTCYSTGCGDKCKKGTNPVSQMTGQPGQLSTSSRCPKGKYQVRYPLTPLVSQGQRLC